MVRSGISSATCTAKACNCLTNPRGISTFGQSRGSALNEVLFPRPATRGLFRVRMADSLQPSPAERGHSRWRPGNPLAPHPLWGAAFLSEGIEMSRREMLIEAALVVGFSAVMLTIFWIAVG